MQRGTKELRKTIVLLTLSIYSNFKVKIRKKILLRIKIATSQNSEKNMPSEYIFELPIKYIS